MKQRIDNFKAKLERANREGDVQTAADIRFNVIPEETQVLRELEKRKKAEEENGESIDNRDDYVTPDAIAEIVGRWTGIPAQRLRTTEKEKLLTMDK